MSLPCTSVRGGREGFQSIKASSLTPDALSMQSQRMSGKLKSPEITILSKWSQT